MTTEVRRPRGRPRPAEAIARDERILRLLAEMPLTRNQLRDALGLTSSITYLALDRLRRQGRVKLCLTKTGKKVWTCDPDAPCP